VRRSDITASGSKSFFGEYDGAQLEFVRAYIAPIRRLHPEFLQEILKYSVPVAYHAVIATERHPCC